jgi:hypothetical protein
MNRKTKRYLDSSITSQAEWNERLQNATTDQLIDIIVQRLGPRPIGPALDDRNSERLEDWFLVLARDQRSFRLRLEDAILLRVKNVLSTGTLTSDAELSSLFRLIELLTITAAFSSIRLWIESRPSSIRDDAKAAAIRAMAMTQPVNSQDVQGLWLDMWQNASANLWALSFIGLRLQAPSAAVKEIPLLLERASLSSQSAGPMLQGIWNQESARPALLNWLAEDATHSIADGVETILKERLSPADLRLFNASRPVTEKMQTPRRSVPKIFGPQRNISFLRI